MRTVGGAEACPGAATTEKRDDRHVVKLLLLSTMYVCVLSFFAVVEYDGFTLQGLLPNKIIQVGQWCLYIRFKQTGTADRGVVCVCMYYYR